MSVQRTAFFDLTSQVFTHISEYAVECKGTPCPDRPLYVALGVMTETAANKRSWDTFQLAGRCKLVVSSWFYLGTFAGNPAFLFSQQPSSSLALPSSVSARAASREEEAQTPLTLPPGLFVRIYPFLMKPETEGVNLGFMRLQGTTYPEVVFSFMEGVHHLEEEVFREIMENPSVFVAQFMNNLWILAQTKRFVVDIDIEWIRQEFASSLINHLQVVFDERFPCIKNLVEFDKAQKISLGEIFKMVNLGLNFFYQIKLLIETLNLHTRLARTILSLNAKNDFTLLVQEHDQIEVRAFINRWFRNENGTFITSLRKKYLRDFESRYCGHANEKIAKLAALSVQLFYLQEALMKCNKATALLQSVRKNLAHKDLEAAVKGYTDYLGADLLKLSLADFSADRLTLVEVKAREGIVEKAAGRLQTIEFMYGVLFRTLSFVLPLLNRFVVKQRATIKNVSLDKRNVIDKRLDVRAMQVRSVEQTEYAYKARNVVQKAMNRFMPGMELPYSSVFARSLLHNPQHGLFESEERDEISIPVAAEAPAAMRLSEELTESALADDAKDALSIPLKAAPPAAPLAPQFLYKDLKSLLRVKDPDAALRPEFLYHDRVLGWFEQLRATGKRWDEVENEGIFVHTFPIALDKYVGSLFSQRGEWVNPRTQQSEVQYKMPIELIRQGAVKRYVLRYTRTKAGIWYHRDMTRQERGLWNQVDFPALGREPLSITSEPKKLQWATKTKTETFDRETGTLLVDFEFFQIRLFMVR